METVLTLDKSFSGTLKAAGRDESNKVREVHSLMKEQLVFFSLASLVSDDLGLLKCFSKSGMLGILMGMNRVLHDISLLAEFFMEVKSMAASCVA